LEEQDRDNPIYYYSDDSVFVAPDPRSDEVGTDRLKITGVRSIASGSWTTSTTETDIKLPIFMFDVLFYGLMWKSSEHMRRDYADIMNKYNFYQSYKLQQVRKMNTETSEVFGTREVNDEITFS
jgi:hypothetical protein